MALEITPSPGRPIPPAALGVRPATAAPVAGAAPAPARAPGPAQPVPAAAIADPDRELLDGNAVRSVDRAAALLLALGECAGEAGVTELARRLGLHKSTASRLLATLQRRGLVEQDEETGKYRLGLVVIRLAERAERTLDLRGIAQPELERLARATHETVSLGVLEADACLTVAQVDGPSMIACPDWTGRSTPLHCVASGKILMAALAERDVMRIARPGLVARTPRTIASLEALMEELARVRRRGYATAFSEWIEGTNGIAVPVVDARGRVVAAIAVWGPAHRVTAARVAEIVTSARATAAAVTARLGGAAA
jgi:DNA-binding IclR family transcriptional regulator